MKKIFLVLAVFLLLGCEKDLNNTPTKRVEVFLSNYQSISEEVEASIVSNVEEMADLTEEEKKSYVELWKRHYQGLTYEIKNETIDGDEATVSVEIEVYDYSKKEKEISEYLTTNPEMFLDESGNHSVEKYNDYKINELSKITDKVKYTIDFNLQKVDKKWILLEIGDDETLKMSGMYNY